MGLYMYKVLNTQPSPSESKDGGYCTDQETEVQIKGSPQPVLLD